MTKKETLFSKLKKVEKEQQYDNPVRKRVDKGQRFVCCVTSHQSSHLEAKW